MNVNERRERRTYSDDFKKQVVELYNFGKPKEDIIKQYNLSSSSFDKWVKRNSILEAWKECDNINQPEQLEIIKLRKENQRLKIENKVLNQGRLF